MEGKRSNPAESDDYSVEQTSDRSSEEQTTETLYRQNKDRNKQICNPCLLERFLRVMAFYLCYVCGKSFCKECFSGHDKSHGFLSLQSESEQLEREIDEYLSYIKNESDAERKKKFMKNNVCVCDYVDTKHGFDKDCYITGLTGYANKWWVVCDYRYHCIKVFSLRSNVLQRYIKLRSEPWDVTEIIVENEMTEQDSASCSETAISGTFNKPDRKYLLAVTLPSQRLILVIDLGKTPAVLHNKIKTEKKCYGIDCYDSNIYAVCEDPSRESPYSVSILSIEGVTLKTFQTDYPRSWDLPYLTVLNGNTYMTDYRNFRVVCYNDEGRVLHEIRIPWSRPTGICVDRSKDKVYIGSDEPDKVYELESDLGRYKPVLDLEHMKRMRYRMHMKHMENRKNHMKHMELMKHMKHTELMERMERMKHLECKERMERMEHMKRMECMKHKKHMERMKHMEHIKLMERMEHMERMERMKHMEHMERMERMEHMERMKHMERMECMKHMERMERMKHLECMERMEHMKRMERMKHMKHMERMKHMEHIKLMESMEHMERMERMKHMERMERMEHMERMKHMEGMECMKHMERMERMKHMECKEPMERMEHIERMKHNERMELMERKERMEHIERMKHMERMEHIERMKHMERNERMKRMERMEHMKHMERIEHMERKERMKHIERMKHMERMEHIELPLAMCFYIDKLYFGNLSRPGSHVTVVRLL